MKKTAIFLMLAIAFMCDDALCARKAQDIKPDKALEEAVKVELGKRIEERELPDPMKENSAKEDKAVSGASGNPEVLADGAANPEAAKGAAAESSEIPGTPLNPLNPMDMVMELDEEKARSAADERVRQYEDEVAAERAMIEEKQGRPSQAGEAEDSSQLSSVVSGGFTGADIETGKEEKNPDLSAAPKVTMYPEGQEAIAPNDAAINPKDRKIDYYVFTTALDRQKWRAKRLDKDIRAFIDDNVNVHVLPSAQPASSLAYIFNHLWDKGQKREALAFLDWAYEHGRTVITMNEADSWLAAHGIKKTGDMKIDPEILEKRLASLNAKIDAMSSLELGWSPSRAANWHDGVVFVDGKFDPELFMRVYGEANPGKAKNFIEPDEAKAENAAPIDLEKPEKEAQKPEK